MPLYHLFKGTNSVVGNGVKILAVRIKKTYTICVFFDLAIPTSKNLS